MKKRDWNQPPGGDTKEENPSPSITATFRNFNIGHVVILAFGLGGTAFLGVHGDAKIQSSRETLVAEVKGIVESSLSPLDKRLAAVEDCDKKLEKIRIEMARLTQAINDSGRFPAIKENDDDTFVVPPPIESIPVSLPGKS